MMECGDIRPDLSAFHDGELSPGRRAEVERHLSSCPVCSAFLESIRRADEAVPRHDPGAAYWESFNRRLAERIGAGEGADAAAKSVGEGFPSPASGGDGAHPPADAAEGEAAAPAPRPGTSAELRPLPGHGWVRHQLRYLLPAAAAALLLVVVRYGAVPPSPGPLPATAPLSAVLPTPGGDRGTAPSVPPVPAGAVVPSRGNAEEPAFREAPRPTGNGGTGVRDTVVSAGRAALPEGPAAKSSPAVGEAPPSLPSRPGAERLRLEDAFPLWHRSERPVPAPDGTGDGEPLRKGGSAPAASAPEMTVSPSPRIRCSPFAGVAPQALPSPPAADEAATERGNGAVAKGVRQGSLRQEAAKRKEGSSAEGRRLSAEEGAAHGTPPACGRSRFLAAQGDLAGAETAQRECLALDRTAEGQERGLLFLAELLDRQRRRTEADRVIGTVRERYPDSRLLEEYLRRRERVREEGAVSLP